MRRWTEAEVLAATRSGCGLYDRRFGMTHDVTGPRVLLGVRRRLYVLPGPADDLSPWLGPQPWPLGTTVYVKDRQQVFRWTGMPDPGSGELGAWQHVPGHDHAH